MGKKYSRSELQEMGMDEDQINASLGIYNERIVNDDRVNTVDYQRGTDGRMDSCGKNDNVPVNCGESMSVTSIFDLQRYAKGTLVRFPDFAEGQPFVARVRRPSMLVLAKQGKIPNALLTSANELFSKGGAGLDDNNENMLSDIYSITEIVCEAALQEPTYQQIKDAGLELSDDQLMAIFNYTQTGVKALESFR